MILSPVSVKLVLGMLYLGLQGHAAEEIEKALSFNSSVRTEVIRKFSKIMQSLEVNSLFVWIKCLSHWSLDRPQESVPTSVFNRNLCTTLFSVRRIMNTNWVSAQNYSSILLQPYNLSSKRIWIPTINHLYSRLILKTESLL